MQDIGSYSLLLKDDQVIPKLLYLIVSSQLMYAVDNLILCV